MGYKDCTLAAYAGMAVLYQAYYREEVRLSLFPNARQCDLASLDRCIYVLQGAEKNTLSAEDAWISHFALRDNLTFTTFCFGNVSDAAVIFGKLFSVSEQCMNEKSCLYWSWLLTAVEAQRDTEWMTVSLLGIALGSMYALGLMVSRRGVSTALCTYFRSSCMVIACLCITDALCDYVGFQRDVVSNCANLMIVGSCLDATLLNIGSDDRGGSRKAFFATVSSMISSSASFAFLYLSIDVAGIRLFFFKGFVGFLLCTLHRFLFFVDSHDYDNVLSERNTLSENSRVSKFLILVAVLMDLCILCQDTPTMLHRATDEYRQGSQASLFFSEMQQNPVRLPFFFVGNGTVTSDVAEQYGMHRLPLPASTNAQLWEMTHDFVIDEDMYNTVKDLSSYAIDKNMCLSCTFCSIVDSFVVLFSTGPRVVLLLSSFVSVIAALVRDGTCVIAGMACVALSQTVAYYLIKFLASGVSLIDLLILVAVPGIAVDYILHVILCYQEKDMICTITHCYATTALCFSGLLFATQTAFFMMARTFLVSLTISYIHAVVLCLLLRWWSN
jgi:hypothetical protein